MTRLLCNYIKWTEISIFFSIWSNLNLCFSLEQNKGIESNRIEWKWIYLRSQIETIFASILFGIRYLFFDFFWKNSIFNDSLIFANFFFSIPKSTNSFCRSFLVHLRFIFWIWIWIHLSKTNTKFEF